MAKRFGSVAVVGAIVATAAVLTIARVAMAQTATIASDRTAGFIIYPKVLSNPDDIFNDGFAVETAFQLTNTSTSTRVVHCFYVNATKHCSNGTNSFDPAPDGKGACRTTQDCDLGGLCQPDWDEVDFTIVLSPGQPVGWNASEGGAPASPGLGNIGPVPENAFIGELKCVEVDGTAITGPGATSFSPINANELKGEATIYGVSPGAAPLSRVDVRTYNAIGIQTVLTNGQTQSDPGGNKVMCLGSNSSSSECTTAEYASCPSTLILNHFFDFNFFGSFADRRTDLTLVPCSENFVDQDAQVVTAVQFSVFNEFEQRMSASTKVECFKEVQLSHIDSRPGRETESIWNVATQGTLSGQTRIRPVTGPETDAAHGLLAVAEEFNRFGTFLGSAAWQLNYSGVNANKADVVRYVPGPGQ
jgi:hypothetical protein